MSDLAIAIAKAAIPIIGGAIFGGSEPSREEQLEEQFEFAKRTELEKYKWIVEGAQAAGFNPLTALRAGGGRVQGPSIAPTTPLTWRDYAREAVSLAAQEYDPIEAESRRLDNELKRTELDRRRSELVRTGEGVTTAAPRYRQPSQQYVRTNKPERIGVGPSGLFPVVDPMSMRPEDMQIKDGRYKGRYVIQLAPGEYYMLAQRTPLEVIEGLLGGLVAEGYGAVEMGMDAVKQRAQRVYLNEHGEVITALPAGRPAARSAQTPDPADWPGGVVKLRPPPREEPPGAVKFPGMVPDYRSPFRAEGITPEASREIDAWLEEMSR